MLHLWNGFFQVVNKFCSISFIAGTESAENLWVGITQLYAKLVDYKGHNSYSWKQRWTATPCTIKNQHLGLNHGTDDMRPLLCSKLVAAYSTVVQRLLVNLMENKRQIIWTIFKISTGNQERAHQLATRHLLLKYAAQNDFIFKQLPAWHNTIKTD